MRGEASTVHGALPTLGGMLTARLGRRNKKSCGFRRTSPPPAGPGPRGSCWPTTAGRSLSTTGAAEGDQDGDHPPQALRDIADTSPPLLTFLAPPGTSWHLLALVSRISRTRNRPRCFIRVGGQTRSSGERGRRRQSHRT